MKSDLYDVNLWLALEVSTHVRYRQLESYGLELLVLQPAPVNEVKRI